MGGGSSTASSNEESGGTSPISSEKDSPKRQKNGAAGQMEDSSTVEHVLEYARFSKLFGYECSLDGLTRAYAKSSPKS